MSILLSLFGVNSVLIIQCTATEYVVSFCTVVYLYNMLDFFVMNISNYCYFHADL